jgi:hypothetical protein
LSRNHFNPDVIRITCTDEYHRGEEDFARLGHHHVGTLRPAEGGYRWHPARDTPKTPAPPGGNSADWSTLLGPVKGYRPDMSEVWVFRCACGRTPERSVADVAALAGERRKACPGRRVEIDIVDLG